MSIEAHEAHETDWIAAYALGCLEPEEAEQVAAHLQTCPACRAELQAYESLCETLSLAAEPVSPPPALKERLMQPIAAPPAPAKRANGWRTLQNLLQRPVPAWSLGVVVLALALFLVPLLRRLSTGPVAPSRSPMGTIALIGTEAVPEAHGVLVVGSDGMEGGLMVEHLPPLDADHQYQLWLIADGQRTSGGVFSVNEGGYAAVPVISPRPLTDYTAFGITIEPAGGSPGPTGQKVLGSVQ